MKEGWCIHYNGLMHDDCKAGQNYVAVAVPLTPEQIDWHNENYPDHDARRTALSKRVPCFARNGISTCELFREPTQEDLEEFNRKIRVAIESCLKTRTAITEWLKENDLIGKSVSGQIACPVCNDGRVDFSYAGSYNGHIHARCSTAGCVSWME